MASFNLAYQPWIPCLVLGSNVPQELSLLDTLSHTHEIREISDDSPLVTIALHRLLLAILHRNFGPASFSQWKKLWQRRHWEGEALAKYFDEWSKKNRFDLFDVERPFYQVPQMRKTAEMKKRGKAEERQEQFEDIEIHPVALLAHEAATGNNGTLFDHSFNDAPIAITPAQAARYLIARQAFSIGGGVSRPFNLSHAPLVGGYTVLVLGDNLFETLALNLLPYNAERPVPHHGADLPCWEQEQLEQPDKNGTLPRGYLDYLTWQSRRIHLIAEGDPPAVRSCQLLQNLKLKDERGDLDPFRCYEQRGKEAFKAKRLNPARALWRDSHTLFQQTGDSTKRPEVFNHLAQIEAARRRGEINARIAFSFVVYGLASDQASILMWSRERLPLPLSYLSEKQLTSDLDDALKLAEKVEETLKEAIKTLAKNLVGDPEAGSLADSFAAKEFYWSRLETPFKKLLVNLADEFERTRESEKTLPEWALTVNSTARAALEHAINSLSGNARELQAAAQAEDTFARQMGRTRKAFAHLFPKTATDRR